MTDKELLELAAKAAGIDLSFNIMLNGGDTPYITDSYISAYEYDEWNPLVDDGDALRLAVKLQLALSLEGTVSLAGWVSGFAEEQAQDFDGNQYAATRRAIVRAAAEIGKGINN